MGPLCFHFLGEAFRAQCLNENLDTRLELVVTAAVAVVNPDNGFQVGQQIQFRQEVADDRANHGGTAKSATDVHPEAEFALVIAHQLQADVMDPDSRTIRVFRGIHGNFEFTW